MCTVSFFRTEDSIIFTSNRDERRVREKAVFPNFLEEEGNILYFPKDRKASGTWFVTDQYGNVAILLNGAFKNHESKPPYKKSRGIVLLDLMKTKDLLNAFRNYDLSGIEPFQLLVYSERKLFRLFWDGNEKYEVSLDENKNHLLSSKTLYDDKIEYDRIQDFNRFQSVGNMGYEEVLNFHKEHQIEKEPGINEIIKEKFVTVSITQLVITENRELRYYDLIDNTLQKQEIGKKNLV
ncbi:hypothetical protein ACM46_02930 [Chryseobacterium angstadtii]|uniref:NRDE family protein n=1 Tax=Chryseobacterium angstadtii TaxID=558151 RepID=A0A0J7IJH2_9FLAO|nr:NRDE family protein [Chryseobacterium angstadtii]KMQ66503.1 hypothetical protein ACM46_02930 [Chryseobacterium angstadtii]